MNIKGDLVRVLVARGVVTGFTVCVRVRWRVGSVRCSGSVRSVCAQRNDAAEQQLNSS